MRLLGYEDRAAYDPMGHSVTHELAFNLEANPISSNPFGISIRCHTFPE